MHKGNIESFLMFDEFRRHLADATNVVQDRSLRLTVITDLDLA